MSHLAKGSGRTAATSGCDLRTVLARSPRRSSRPPPDALLTRSDLRDLGLEGRAIDAVFRAVPVVVLPGYTRPMIRVCDYLDLIKRSTYDGSRVR